MSSEMTSENAIRHDDALAAARELGRRDGEDFDQALRRLEDTAREARLGELAFTHHGGARASAEAERKIDELEDKLDKQTVYLQAVLNSRPWRLVSWVRSLLGRQW